MLLNGFDTVSVDFLTEGSSADTVIDEMFAASGDPSKIDDKFAITIVGAVEFFPVKGIGVLSVDNEWGKDQVTFLFATIAFDKHSTFSNNSVQIDFFAVPSFGVVVLEFSFD